MNLEEFLASGAFASIVLEGIKKLIRLAISNSTYDFPKWFYIVSVPVVNVLLGLLLAVLGFEGFSLPTDWASFARQLFLLVLASLSTLGTYKFAIKPLKDYEPVR